MQCFDPEEIGVQLLAAATLLLGNLASLTGKEESTRSRSVKRQSWQRFLEKHWGQKLMCTSNKKAVFLDTVGNLMCTSRKRGLFLEADGILIYASKIWGLFLEADSKDERYLRRFCWVSVGGPAVLKSNSDTFDGFMSEVLLF